MQVKDLRRSSRVTYREAGFYGVSAWSGANASIRDLVVAGDIEHRQIRQSTVGRIRSQGFEVLLTGPPMHCTIKFDTEPADIVLEQLAGAFDPSEPNLWI